MAWTTPSDRATGFLVTAAIYNAEIIDNLLYLHGDAGTISLISQLTDTSGFSTGPSSTSFTGTQTHGVYADGNGQVASFCNAAVTAFAAGAINDTVARWSVDSNGSMSWGPGGSTAQDLNISRASAGLLKVGGSAGKGNVKGGFGSTAPGLPATATPDTANMVYRIAPINNSGALTIAAPTNQPTATEGAILIIIVKAPAGGLTTVTWNAIYKGSMATSWAANLGTVHFFFWDGGTSTWQLLTTATEN